MKIQVKYNLIWLAACVIERSSLRNAKGIKYTNHKILAVSTTKMTFAGWPYLTTHFNSLARALTSFLVGDNFERAIFLGNWQASGEAGA